MSSTQAERSKLRALVFIHDLGAHNAHLMPWRTVCEVVERGKKKGYDLNLVSLGGAHGVVTGLGIPPGTRTVSKSRHELTKELRELAASHDCEVIVWPVVWREPYWRIRAVGQLGIPVIGYLPGGVYRLRDALYAARRIGFRRALPYLADAIWLKRLQLTRWRRHGFCHLITMTSLTAQAAVKAGWPECDVTAIPPGRDGGDEERTSEALPEPFVVWRNRQPFYLFAGPPSGIRGIYELLASFDRMARVQRNIRLVCLFRSDARLESARIADIIDKMPSREQIYCVWESLGRRQLEAFMAACHAIVLPFVAVPSEIPLAIIEAMRYEKPVITTMTGGSGEFVRSFGASVPLGNIEALASAMTRLLVDPGYYTERCKATREAYQQHPDWNTMADSWIDCISRSCSASTGKGRGG